MWTCFRSVDRLTLPLWRRRAWKCATEAFLCWVPIVRGLIWLVTRRCKLSTDGCGSRGPSGFPETGTDRRTLSLIFLGRMRLSIGERDLRALGGGTVHRTRVPTCLARCARRILPQTDLSVRANISDSDADKGYYWNTG